ncbi:MAG: SDR family NAD(P)-dependent oxidoreductase [Burkholderiales bacterium]|nr:SDR family NAD(P)-dependent oxidoreductase [Burkholderiales bacterium]
MAARVAIVTGAAQGLGATYAEALAAEGARVCVADVLDAEPVAAAIRGAGGQAIAAACDVTDPASVRAMVDATVRAFDGVDILVNNAALFAKLALSRCSRSRAPSGTG